MAEESSEKAGLSSVTNEHSIPTPVSVKSLPKSDKIASQEEGFCCVVSMHDGVVLFTTPSITESLGFPRDMWLGRSFIDFVHPKDRQTFAGHISSDVPFTDAKQVGVHREVKNHLYVMLRRYRGLRNAGYGVTAKEVNYEPYKLVLNFREGPDSGAKDDAGAIETDKKKLPYTSTMLLIISATPVTHIYKRESQPQQPTHSPGTNRILFLYFAQTRMKCWPAALDSRCGTRARAP